MYKFGCFCGRVKMLDAIDLAAIRPYCLLCHRYFMPQTNDILALPDTEYEDMVIDSDIAWGMLVNASRGSTVDIDYRKVKNYAEVMSKGNWANATTANSGRAIPIMFVASQLILGVQRLLAVTISDGEILNTVARVK